MAFTISAPTMALSVDPGYRSALWRIADALRGRIDATDFKHIELGPVSGIKLIGAEARATDMMCSVYECNLSI